MEFKRLKFNLSVTFDVANVEDYHVKPTFDPNAASDIDYYGYRETSFDVTAVYHLNAVGEHKRWQQVSKEMLEMFTRTCDSKATLIVQDAIDEGTL